MMKIVEIFHWILLACAYCSAIVIFGTIAGEMVLRAAGSSLLVSLELTGLLMPLLVYGALAEVTKRRAHIRVDVVLAALGPRTRHAIESIGRLVFFFFLVSLLVLTLDLAYGSYRDGDRSDGFLRVPLWLPQAFISLGLLAAVASLAVSIKRGPTTPEETLRIE